MSQPRLSVVCFPFNSSTRSLKRVRLQVLTHRLPMQQDPTSWLSMAGQDFTRALLIIPLPLLKWHQVMPPIGHSEPCHHTGKRLLTPGGRVDWSQISLMYTGKGQLPSRGYLGSYIAILEPRILPQEFLWCHTRCILKVDVSCTWSRWHCTIEDPLFAVLLPINAAPALLPSAYQTRCLSLPAQPAEKRTQTQVELKCTHTVPLIVAVSIEEQMVQVWKWHPSLACEGCQKGHTKID